MEEIKFTYEQVKLLYLLARRQEYDIDTTNHAYCVVEIAEHIERYPELRSWILRLDILADGNANRILQERLKICVEDKEYFKKELIDTIVESYKNILFNRRYSTKEENIVIKG